MSHIDSELRKISEGVFDNATLFAIEKLIGSGKINRFSGMLSRGKEANLYHGFSKEGKEIAIKVYAVETSDFRNMDKYIRGDVRFPRWKNQRHLVHLWAKKEFHNLSKIHGKVKCPEPFGVEENVLVMSFLGEKGIPAPRLKDGPLENPKDGLKKILSQVRKMYRENLVHGDLSEYNILNWNEEPWLIDFSMGVLIDNPLAEGLLRRDVHNILKYFGKLGIKKEEAEVFEWIKK